MDRSSPSFLGASQLLCGVTPRSILNPLLRRCVSKGVLCCVKQPTVAAVGANFLGLVLRGALGLGKRWNLQIAAGVGQVLLLQHQLLLGVQSEVSWTRAGD